MDYRVLGRSRDGDRLLVRSVGEFDRSALAERAAELERIVAEEDLDEFEAQLRRAELTGDLATEIAAALGEPRWVAATGYADAVQSVVDDLRPGHLVSATVTSDGEGAGGANDGRFDGAVEVRDRLRLRVHGDCPPLSLLDAAYERMRTGATNMPGELPGIALPFEQDGVEAGTVVVVPRFDGERDLWPRVRTGREGLLEQLTTDVGQDGEPRRVLDLFLFAPRDRPFLGLVTTWDTAAGRTASEGLRAALSG